MHPLIARIHPSYRTAILAWLMSRVLIWAVVLVGTNASLAQSVAQGAGSAPMWGLLSEGFGLGLRAAGLLGGLWTPLFLLTILGELALLFGAIAVYRFARRDNLPHVAERATWFWLFCPLMAWTVADPSWAIAVGLGAVTVSAASMAQHRLALLACAFAMGFKPEFVLLWPGLAALGWKSYSSGKQPAYTPWLLTIGPLAAFTGWILFATGMAGRAGISLRGLHGQTTWRTSLSWQGWEVHGPDIILLICIALILGLCLQFWSKSPRVWPLVILPCVLWPLAHQPAVMAGATILFALPAFAHLSRAAENPSIERPLLVGLAAGLLVAILL